MWIKIILAVLLIGYVTKAVLTSEPAKLSPTPTPTLPPQVTLQPASAEDTVRQFISLLSSGQSTAAAEMMASDSAVWATQFAALTKVSLVSLSPATDNSFQVVLDISPASSSASAPIPYYGYAAGQNTRWISAVRINDQWKIAGIATGP